MSFTPVTLSCTIEVTDMNPPMVNFSLGFPCPVSRTSCPAALRTSGCTVLLRPIAAASKLRRSLASWVRGERNLASGDISLDRDVRMQLISWECGI